MSEKDFNEIISRNIAFFMSLNGYNQVEIAKAIGVSEASVSTWLNAKKSPRMDKVDKMCELFGISRDDLLISNHEQSYYTDKETQEIADDIKNNKELKLLFSAARDASPEDLETAHQMLLALKRKEKGNDY